MTQETQVTTTEEASPETFAAPMTDRISVPLVDICESGDEIRLVAEMPGVSQDTLDVTVENNVLTIEGRAVIEAPDGFELVGQEYGVGRYRRDFSLSNQVDVDGIRARVKHGLLELSIPKKEEVKTRKIEISG